MEEKKDVQKMTGAGCAFGGALSLALGIVVGMGIMYFIMRSKS